MALSQEIILSFLLEHGGKVKNSQLVSKFKGFLNCGDPAEKKQNRELFKRLVNSVAVVLQVDDVKYVAVKKKHQGFNTGENIPRNNSSKDKPVEKLDNLDSINNNCCHHSPRTGGNRFESMCRDSIPCEKMPSGTARVLSVPSDSKTGSVFAIVAINPPQCKLKCNEKEMQNLPSDKLHPPVEKIVKVNAHLRCRDAFLYRSLRVKRKGPQPESPQLQRSIKSSGIEVKDTNAIPLGAMEHEWLVKSATGSWRQICSLLLQVPQLAAKPNFMSGFTILHWAAKSGNGEIVCKVMDAMSPEINVNVKSYDGYTPLHIAAIHARERVLWLLVCEYGANTNIRDNSGKKPYYYLNQDVPAEIRQMLGDPCSLKQDAVCYLKDEEGLSKGLRTFTKLFQPHVAGQKKKYRRRISFHFTRDDDEEH